MNDQRLLHWIDEPVMRDAVGVKHLKLVDDVTLCSGRRQQLARPVRTDPDGPADRTSWQTITTPTNDVVQVDFVGLVLELDLVTEPPSARPTPPRFALESTPENSSECEL